MNVSDVNLRHIFALPDIAATGRMRAAAERLFMSQSALTQALRKLEDRAGTSLFQRQGYGMIPTDAGVLLVHRAERAIELLAQAERELRPGMQQSSTHHPLHRHVTAGQLRALIAVTDSGGYSSAARNLRLAQPTVYRAARDLENIVGIRLFTRAARGVTASDAAETLARFAGLVLAEIRQGFEQVGELAGRTDSRIAVGSLPLARSEFLPTAVIRLTERFPDAGVSILDGPYDEQLDALRHGHIDWLIGALREPLPAADVVQEALFEQPLAVVVRPGHALLRRGTPSAIDLAKLDWIAPPPRAPAREEFRAFFQRSGVDMPTRIVECGSLIATRGLLQQSDRAALLSPLQVRSDVESKQLAILVDSIPGTERSIGVTTRDNWEPTRVQAEFGQILAELAREILDAALQSQSKMGL